MAVVELTELGDRIRHVRGDRSQAEFGAPLGVEGAAVSAWELGKTRSPTAANLFRIEDVYGFSARWIATGDGPERAESHVRDPRRRELLRLVQTLPEEHLATAARMLGALA